LIRARKTPQRNERKAGHETGEGEKEMFYTLPREFRREDRRLSAYRGGGARARSAGMLNNQSAVLALATAVRDLYDKMDHTLRFPAEIPRAAAASP